jgi:hypothetical protein
VPDDANAQILQVLSRQARQDGFVDLVIAESRLIPFEAKAPQPTSEVHEASLRLADVCVEVLPPHQIKIIPLRGRFSGTVGSVSKSRIAVTRCDFSYPRTLRNAFLVATLSPTNRKRSQPAVRTLIESKYFTMSISTTHRSPWLMMAVCRDCNNKCYRHSSYADLQVIWLLLQKGIY